MDAPRPFPVSPPDSAWLRMEDPTNPMTITGVIGLGAELPLDALRRFVSERLVRFDRFRMRIEGVGSSRPRWVADERFDLGHHVTEASLPAPGGKEGLEALVSELMSTPLSFAHSPWTFHLVHDVDHGDGTRGSAVVVRVHHVIGDGIALMHVLIHAVDEYADSEGSTDTASPAAETRPSSPKQASPWRRAGGGVASLGHLLTMRPDSDTVFKGRTSPVKRAAWTGPIPLDTVRAIGEAMGAKINDVLMSSAAGAIRRYLLALGEPVEGVTVRMATPFNVRPLARAHELGNSFGLVFVALPVGEATADARLRVTKERMDAVKQTEEPAVVYAILQTIGRAPMWAHRFVVDLFQQKASGVLTNVPGPQEPLHIEGAPITTLMFWVPQAGDIGLGISILSLDGTVRVGITSDAALVEDPAVLAQAFEEEFAALREAFGGPPAGASA
ncbi:wax ester/triacylglycerol synthase family O-acyltransferase [Rubrivirga sp.]|uniref:wax ester/triacylglycerol synthase family O-acyltransferase n=1 Tax=Rubrivirga sp. TaxID=1885344 RepID=UPI003B52F49D